MNSSLALETLDLLSKDFTKKLPIFIRNAVLITIKIRKKTKEFFATTQNKLHFAICGKTASEIIYSRADSQKENMKYFC
jgi:hypothetical protein